MHRNHVSLVDEFGQPISTRLHEALIRLVPRLQHRFPTLKDEYALTEVLEETARNIVAREERSGPLKELDPYAWVALKNTAARRLHRGGWAVVGATLTAEQSSPVLASLPSTGIPTDGPTSHGPSRGLASTPAVGAPQQTRGGTSQGHGRG